MLADRILFLVFLGSLALLLSAPFTAYGQGTLEGIVTHVRDGDTIEVNGAPVRLQGLHAPEMDEPGGHQARRFIVRLVAGKHVTCALDGRDRHGRHVGIGYRFSLDIARELVRAGLGRDCPWYSGGRYALYETQAGRRLTLPRYCR